MGPFGNNIKTCVEMYLIKEHIRNIIGNMLGTKSFKPKNLQVLLQTYWLNCRINVALFKTHAKKNL